MQKTSRKERVNNRRVPMTAVSRILGVSRPHLSNVIHGNMKSPDLLARYNALIRKREDAQAALQTLTDLAHRPAENSPHDHRNQ
jgi:plasmid maintenance system antidote protein VapI